MHISQKVFIALLAVGLAQVIIYYPQLPDPMASHFDGQGVPNGWMSRQVFFMFHIGIIALLAVSFLFIPSLLRVFPYQTWNIPNRDYWLAPERVEETVRNIKEQTLWCGAVTTAFMILVVQLSIEANLNPPPVLSSSVIWLLIGYFAYIAVWLFRFLMRYRLPK